MAKRAVVKSKVGADGSRAAADAARAGKGGKAVGEKNESGQGAASPTRSPGGIAKEIGKRSGFELPEQEAYLNILRTASVLGEDVLALLKQHGLSEATYNALRILRGSDEVGKACNCSQIAADMVARVPDITRIVDRLEQAGLATRARVSDDRRVVLVRITRAGGELLAKIDEPLLKVHAAQLGHLSRAELERLSELLVKARGGGEGSGERGN